MEIFLLKKSYLKKQTAHPIPQKSVIKNIFQRALLTCILRAKSISAEIRNHFAKVTGGNIEIIAHQKPNVNLILLVFMSLGVAFAVVIFLKTFVIVNVVVDSQKGAW